MAGLLRAEDISRSADLQIAHCDTDSRAELREIADRGKALFRHLFQDHVSPVHQEGKGGTVRSSDSSPQLIQLGKSHLIGIVNDDRVGVRNVKSGLNDGRADQNVDLAVHKIHHDVFELVLFHLTMRIDHPRFRHQRLNLCRDLIDIADPVVDIVDLTVARHLSPDCLADNLVAVLHDIGLNRQTVHRSLFQNAHVTDSGQRHVESPRNRRCGQRQNVDIFP